MRLRRILPIGRLVATEGRSDIASLPDASPRLFFDRQPVESLNALLSKYSDSEFESPYRSTIPLLSLVQHGRETLREILARCGFRADPDLHFEFQVRSPSGSGKASHTDLMVRTGQLAMAVEAKWTESPYQSVAKWLGISAGDNRAKVLSGWLQLIQPFASNQLTAGQVSAVTYQTIHRAASACAAGEQPQLSYLQFISKDRDGAICEERLADLGRLRTALGSSDRFPLRLIDVGIEATPLFEQIAILPKGAPTTAPVVKQGLLAGPFFKFGSVRVRTL